ncbi:MAG TPA: GNAT family N-acetyltransferase [Burkholderiales bacterium]
MTRIRAIRPDDTPAYARLIERTDDEDLRLRFFSRHLPGRDLSRYTHVDGQREMAFVAVDEQGEILGEVRVFHPDGGSAEFALLVRSDAQRRGLGRALLGEAIRHCRSHGCTALFGQVRPDNEAMLALARRCGMSLEYAPGGDLVVVHLDLRQRAAAGAPR